MNLSHSFDTYPRVSAKISSLTRLASSALSTNLYSMRVRTEGRPVSGTKLLIGLPLGETIRVIRYQPTPTPEKAGCKETARQVQRLHRRVRRSRRKRTGVCARRAPALRESS